MRRAIAIGLLLAVAPAGAARAEVELRTVGEFEQPVHVTGAPGDGERLYVVQQSGKIRVWRGGTVGDFLDLTDQVEFAGEQGLLSMVFAPDFQASRRLYVYYTETGGQANRIDELRAPTGDAVDPGSRRLVLSIPHTTAGNHNGGQIQFGPDGMLYAAPGDGGNTPELARDLDSLLGKVLRIDPRGAGPGDYSVPPDNPYVGLPGRDEIWAHGLRNPFRFAFDRLTGDLTIGDVGEGTTEEINHLPRAAGGGRGADFGWNVCEGSFATGSTTTPCPLAGSVLPAIEQRRDDGFRSIIPGYVVRDPSLPSLLGRLVYGDFFVDRPRSAIVGPTGASDDREIGPQVTIDALSSFGEDAGGCVYAASRNGPVYRLVETDTRIPCPAPASPPDTGPPAAGPSPAPSPREVNDPRPLIVAVRVPARQRVLRLRGVAAYVRCSRRCRVAAGGRLRIGKRRFALRRVTTRPVDARTRVRVKVRLTRRGTRALRRALPRGRRARVRIGLRARDTAGTPSRLVRRTVRVAR